MTESERVNWALKCQEFNEEQKRIQDEQTAKIKK